MSYENAFCRFIAHFTLLYLNYNFIFAPIANLLTKRIESSANRAKPAIADRIKSYRKMSSCYMHSAPFLLVISCVSV